MRTRRHDGAAGRQHQPERAGEVVSRDEIINRAWGRQHLSPNSVAVVIGDLRRALDVLAGEAGSIDTVPKAGYRLIAGSDEPAAEQPRALWRWLAAAALALIALLAAFLLTQRAASARPEVAIVPIEDAMGTNRFAPLIRACNETVLVELGKHGSSFSIVEAASAAAGARPDYVLQQRWVLWSGQPELVLVARDAQGRTVWSGAIFGEESSFPAKIAGKLDEFSAWLERASRGRSQ